MLVGELRARLECHDGAMMALADVCPLLYINPQAFPHVVLRSDVTGDTSHLVLYLCTERIPQYENSPLGQMKFSRQLGLWLFPIALGIDFFLDVHEV